VQCRTGTSTRTFELTLESVGSVVFPCAALPSGKIQIRHMHTMSMSQRDSITGAAFPPSVASVTEVGKVGILTGCILDKRESTRINKLLPTPALISAAYTPLVSLKRPRPPADGPPPAARRRRRPAVTSLPVRSMRRCLQNRLQTAGQSQRHKAWCTHTPSCRRRQLLTQGVSDCTLPYHRAPTARVPLQTPPWPPL
jgi:hypothetical protein